MQEPLKFHEAPASAAEEETAQIRQMRARGDKLQSIALRFGISISYASQIATGALDASFRD